MCLYIFILIFYYYKNDCKSIVDFVDASVNKDEGGYLSSVEGWWFLHGITLVGYIVLLTYTKYGKIRSFVYLISIDEKMH